MIANIITAINVIITMTIMGREITFLFILIFIFILFYCGKNT